MVDDVDTGTPRLQPREFAATADGYFIIGLVFAMTFPLAAHDIWEAYAKLNPTWAHNAAYISQQLRNKVDTVNI